MLRRERGEADDLDSKISELVALLEQAVTVGESEKPIILAVTFELPEKIQRIINDLKTKQSNRFLVRQWEGLEPPSRQELVELTSGATGI
ncbi:hypothetical protein AYI68_g7858, partial [Smittium mucronatum]